MLGYMTERQAKANSFTHHGSYYGIPVWIGDPHGEFRVATKWAPFEFLMSAAHGIEGFCGRCSSRQSARIPVRREAADSIAIAQWIRPARHQGACPARCRPPRWHPSWSCGPVPAGGRPGAWTPSRRARSALRTPWRTISLASSTLAVRMAPRLTDPSPTSVGMGIGRRASMYSCRTASRPSAASAGLLFRLPRRPGQVGILDQVSAVAIRRERRRRSTWHVLMAWGGMRTALRGPCGPPRVSLQAQVFLDLVHQSCAYLFAAVVWEHCHSIT